MSSVAFEQSEAMKMSDRIAVINHGILRQAGTAQEICNRRHTNFVAGFVGQIDFLEYKVIERCGDEADLEACGTPVRTGTPDNKFSIGDTATIAICPERLTIHTTNAKVNCDNRVEGA